MLSLLKTLFSPVHSQEEVMKKVFGLIAVLTLTAGALFAYAPPVQPKIPPCGDCWEQTFNSSSLSCGGAARDCLNCTVCD